MDDQPPQENPPADFNKLDLSQLQGFSFGTQWTQDKSAAADRHSGESGGDRPRRDDRRGGPGGGGAPQARDRRPFRRPAGPGGEGPSGAPASAGGAPERREFSGGPRPRREDGPGGGGDYRGGPRYGGRSESFDRGPYESPFFAATFYPEDTSFNTLVQTIRKSCRTIELFEIARTVVAKTERFVVVVTRKTPVESGAPAPGGEVAARPAKAPFYISVPDHLPFESDEAAVAHVLSKHLGVFFDTAEVEVEPPKGNFQVINKCGVTGELLGPPNYHRYTQIVQQHHAAKVARMAFEAFRSRIETIRDPEVVKQWLDKMKKTTRYTWKLPTGAKPVVAPVVAATAEPTPAETPAAETPVSETAAVAAAEPTPAPVAVPETPTFDSLEEARIYLLTHARDKVVRPAENARFHGSVAETMPPGEIRRAIEGALERQRKFPLDTANALRGRLRREHFTIFKKGSKGVSYVCAVKRKFRVPGQMFSDSIGSLISFIETHPMIRASELPTKLLGIALHVPALPAIAGLPVPEEPKLSVEERAKIARLQGDLMWLVHEGYVTEFIDGRLFAPPPMAEARKKEVEGEEHDPENFPEVPASSPPFEVAPPAPAPIATVPATVEPAPAEVPVETVTPPPVTPVAEEPKPEPPGV